MPSEPVLVDVAVRGGDLTVAMAGPPPARARAVVLLLHGTAGSHRAWSLVAGRLGTDVAVVAPDLRGRGGSEALPPPFGLRAHADDCAAVLDRLGAPRAVVAGHGLGGFVAGVLAERCPEVVAAVVLVDGGLAAPPERSTHAEAVLAADVGRVAGHLGRVFPSREEHRRHWRAHPCLGPVWNQAVEAYVAYDAGGMPPRVRSRVHLDAVRVDAGDVLLDRPLATAAERCRCPVEVLRAERGPWGDTDALIPVELAHRARAGNPRLRAVTVPGSDHHGLLLAPAGADAVAAAVRRAVAIAAR